MTSETAVAAATGETAVATVTSEPEPTEGTDPVVRVTDLLRSYGSGASVGPLTFEVPRGVVTGLVGPNGVGKTTTIRMLLGLIEPHEGELHLLDARSWSELPLVLGRVGALVDGPALVPTLTGRKNLQMLSRLAGWSDEAVDQALEIVGLTERAHRRVREYSLGMRQRLALAGALLGDPDLLIVDEPANGLDPQGVAELRQLLSRVAAGGTTVVVSSHVLSEVEQVCDHLVVMSDRGVAYHGSRQQLAEQLSSSLLVELADPHDQQRWCELLRAQNYDVQVGADGAITIQCGPGSSEDQADAGGRQAPPGGVINQLAIDAGIVLSRIEPRAQSLEDIFFELTGAPGSTAERLGASLHQSAASQENRTNLWRKGKKSRS